MEEDWLSWKKHIYVVVKPAITIGENLIPPDSWSNFQVNALGSTAASIYYIEVSIKLMVTNMTLLCACLWLICLCYMFCYYKAITLLPIDEGMLLRVIPSFVLKRFSNNKKLWYSSSTTLVIHQREERWRHKNQMTISKILQVGFQEHWYWPNFLALHAHRSDCSLGLHNQKLHLSHIVTPNKAFSQLVCIMKDSA